MEPRLQRLRSAVFFLADPVLLELLVQVRPRGADGGGGGRYVPFALAQLLDQEGSLRRFFEISEGGRGVCRGRTALRGTAQYLRQVLNPDFLPLHHDEEALHGVLELAHVAPPTMPLQSLARPAATGLRSKVALRSA